MTLLSRNRPTLERLVRTTYWTLLSISVFLSFLCVFVDPLFDIPTRSSFIESGGLSTSGGAAVLLLVVSVWIRQWAWSLYSLGAWVGGLGIGLFLIRSHVP